MSKNLPGRMLNKQSIDTEWPQADNLRPRCLANFMGQQRIKQNLKIFIDAAKQRQEALDHIIFYGPAGFGKTTLANIIAQELGVNFKPTAAPLLSKPCDIAALLTNLQPHEVLFIDEIHRLNKAIEEILYPAMEDGHLDIIAGKGPAAQNIRINIPPFTLIGATTRIGLLSKPLRDRFGINVQFEPYSNDELLQIIQNTTQSLSVTLTNDASSFLSQCSRGTPRIAIRLAKRIRDFLQTHNQASADAAMVCKILEQLGIDEEGLDQYDRKYLRFIGQHYYDTAVGIETIAAALSESCNNIEEVIEPYLIEKGFIQKTARGRVLSAHGKTYYSHTLLSKNI